MITDLSTDILRCILQNYLEDDEARYLVKTCKRMYKIDYLKLLWNNHTTEREYITTFSVIFAKHFRTLEHICISGFTNPFTWIRSKLPETVMINRCILKDKLDPPISDTKYLYIDSCSMCNIRINWRKFPKLKKIRIQSHCVDLIGLDLCTKLERIRFELKMPKEDVFKYIPNTIQNLMSNTKPNYTFVYNF